MGSIATDLYAKVTENGVVVCMYVCHIREGAPGIGALSAEASNPLNKAVSHWLLGLLVNDYK